jgi:uncharacterized membrane protein YhhN
MSYTIYAVPISNKIKIIYMKDILVDNKHIYNFEYNFLVIFSWVTKFTVLLFIIGFIQNKPQWLIEFNFFVKLSLALFLMYRFNSHRKYKIEFTDLDRKVCYSAGLYIFLLSFIEYINIYTDKLRSFIQPHTKPISDLIK